MRASRPNVLMNALMLVAMITVVMMAFWVAYKGYEAMFRGFMPDEFDDYGKIHDLTIDLEGRVRKLEMDNQKLMESNQQLIERNKELEELLAPLRSPISSTITSYCPCPICCGPKATGRTFTGQLAEENHTVAVDPRVIPLGSTVFIEGIGWRVAQDIGGAVDGRHVDVFYKTHKVAVERGVQEGVNVYVWPVAQ